MEGCLATVCTNEALGHYVTTQHSLILRNKYPWLLFVPDLHLAPVTFHHDRVARASSPCPSMRLPETVVGMGGRWGGCRRVA